MSDLIDREALLDIIGGVLIAPGELMTCVKIYEAIKDAPTVEPKRGEWVWYCTTEDMDEYHCSECDWAIHIWAKHYRKANFCPNCGADMRGAG